MPAVFEITSRDDAAMLSLRELDGHYFVAESRGLNLTAHSRVGVHSVPLQLL